MPRLTATAFVRRLLLGANLWALLVGVPLLHAGGAPGWTLAAALAPLALLLLACALPAAPLTAFAFPASLLLPLLLYPPLRAALPATGALVVGLSLVAWVVGRAPRARAVRAWPSVVLLAAALALLLYASHLSEPLVAWLQRTLPGRVEEARIVAALSGFVLWLGAAWAVLASVSRRARRRMT